MKELQITPSRTVVTSFTPKTTAASQQQQQQYQSSQEDYFEQGDWVLCVTSNSNWVSCALSNGEIQVYDQERLHASHISYSQNSLITDLVHEPSNPNALIASAADGTVTLYDIRQAQPAWQVKLPRPEEEALSVSLGFDGTIAAVGSNKANIHFFDLRDSRSLLGTYSQSHTNEITRVRFQTLSSFGTTTSTTPVLVSAAEDGLACVFDTSQPTEEAALKNILTVQSPIREIGFFGPQSEAIYCLTGSESLLLYHKDDTNCRKDFGPHLRQSLSQEIGATTASNSTSIAPVEYLVDCYWDTPRQELLLLAGSATGDAAVFRVNDQQISVAHHLHGGHRGVVRAWNPLSSNVFVTVGEDARMCEWNRLGHQMHSALKPKAPNIIVPQTRRTVPVVPLRSGGGKLRRPRSRMTASPY
jgi:WD40 repeat protein